MDQRDLKASCGGFDAVLEMIGGKWKLWILRVLIYGGTKRFNELRREINGITQTMLTNQLRALERDGLVVRKVFAEVPPRVEYSPTQKARDLEIFFDAMFDWATKHVPSHAPSSQTAEPTADAESHR